MLITFDGFSGAGKTTQVQRVLRKMECERLFLDGDASSCIDTLFRGAGEIKPEISMLKQLLVNNSRILKGSGDKAMLLEWFYSPFFFSCGEEMLDLLDLWSRCLYTVPTISFFLDLPYETALRRREERDGVVLLGNIGGDLLAERDAAVAGILARMDTMLSHFYVVDASQEVDEVELDIEMLLLDCYCG